MTALFISDLHLDAAEPETIRRFTDFVEREARAARRAVRPRRPLRGVGRRRRRRPAARPRRSRACARSRARACRARRDARQPRLPARPRFCAATGCRLLGDYERIELDGNTVLLTHGDLLCTDDTRYMSLRGTAAQPGVATRLPREAARRTAQDRCRAAAAERGRDRREVLRHHGRESSDRGAHDARVRRERAAARPHAPPRDPPLPARRPTGDPHRARRLVRASAASFAGTTAAFASTRSPNSPSAARDGRDALGSARTYERDTPKSRPCGSSAHVDTERRFGGREKAFDAALCRACLSRA